MRIITGKYKGRHFDIPRTFKARPTTDFAKENIFNVLTGYIDLEDAEALDLFSGTGSITLELLSRGCSHVTSVELDRDHFRFIKECVTKLNLPQPSPWIGIKGDVFRFLRSCRQQYDFIFADPPYALKELPQIPDLVLSDKLQVTSDKPTAANLSPVTSHLSLLKPEGIFVFEHGKDQDFSQHPCFVDHRQYGSVNFSIFKNP